MKFVLGLSIVLLITMSSPSAKATDLWTLYDNFNSEFLDIGKWVESQSRSGGVVALEEVREIEGQRLYMLIRAHGPTQGGLHRGDKSIAFPDPNAIRGVKASIKVNELDATQCSDQGVTYTRARARFSGSFFNTLGGCGQFPSPCGQAFDVAAQILIQRFSNSTDKPGILRIVGEVFECLDPNCFQGDHYQSVELGTVGVGQWATVSVEWDYANEQFIFQLGKGLPKVIDYDMPFVSLPNSPYKILGLSNRVPYCSSGRQVGFIGADFENVFVKFVE